MFHSEHSVHALWSNMTKLDHYSVPLNCITSRCFLSHPLKPLSKGYAFTALCGTFQNLQKMGFCGLCERKESHIQINSVTEPLREGMN